MFTTYALYDIISDNALTFYSELFININIRNNKNIKIINNIKHESYILRNNSNYYKIINILIDYDTLLNNVIDNSDSNKRYYIIQTNYSAKTNILEVHYINNYIKTPHCLENRLWQFSGTCWLNAMLNSLILSTEILKKEFYIYKLLNIYIPLPYSELRNDSKIKNIKDIPIRSDGDFMIVLGAKLNSLTERFCEHLSSLFDDTNIIKNEDAYKNCGANNTNLLKIELCKNGNGDVLSTECKYSDDTNICGEYEIDTNKYNGFIYGIGRRFEGIIKLLNIITNNNITKTIYNIFNYDDISTCIIFNNFKKEFVYRDIQYKLCSVYLASSEHAIVGTLDSNNNFYLYDSSAKTNYYIKYNLEILLDGLPHYIDVLRNAYQNLDYTNNNNKYTYSIKYALYISN